MKHQVANFISIFQNADSHIEVQTSGSTGTPKQMRVEKLRMLASARRTNDKLGLKPDDVAIVCLPMDYIAGKMMVVRALERNMHMEIITPSSNPLIEFEASKLGKQTLLAVTPHQLAEILTNKHSLEIIKRISHIIIGGGAISERIELMVKNLPGHIYATYGMTETLSHIALRRINGEHCEKYFSAFEGITLGQDKEGCLTISDPLTTETPIITNDIVELLSDGRFSITGRRDNIVCSGGIKLQIEKLEDILTEVICQPFQLTYVNDERFGQALTMLYQGKQTPDELRQLCLEKLKRHEVPKHYFSVKEIPLTTTGKPARKTAHELAEAIALSNGKKNKNKFIVATL